MSFRYTTRPPIIEQIMKLWYMGSELQCPWHQATVGLWRLQGRHRVGQQGAGLCQGHNGCLLHRDSKTRRPLRGNRVPAHSSQQQCCRRRSIQARLQVSTALDRCVRSSHAQTVHQDTGSQQYWPSSAWPNTSTSRDVLMTKKRIRLAQAFRSLPGPPVGPRRQSRMRKDHLT
jgi:hypothetical protein